jgi:hypothetical protein
VAHGEAGDSSSHHPITSSPHHLIGHLIKVHLINLSTHHRIISSSHHTQVAFFPSVFSLRDTDDNRRGANTSSPVLVRDANPGGPGGPPSHLASRLHSIPTHFLLNFHGI